jgi:putative lipoprotein
MSLLLILAVLGQPPLSARPDSLDNTPKPINVESVSLHREPDRWFAMDKFWHFSASFVTVGAAYHFGEDRVELSHPWATGLAVGGTLTLGFTKEFYDLAGPGKHFSWKDLVADAAGIGAGYFAFIHRF